MFQDSHAQCKLIYSLCSGELGTKIQVPGRDEILPSNWKGHNPNPVHKTNKVMTTYKLKMTSI